MDFPSDLAREIPACVRSISRSRSNSATAFSTCIVIRPGLILGQGHPLDIVTSVASVGAAEMRGTLRIGQRHGGSHPRVFPTPGGP